MRTMRTTTGIVLVAETGIDIATTTENDVAESEMLVTSSTARRSRRDASIGQRPTNAGRRKKTVAFENANVQQNSP